MGWIEKLHARLPRGMPGGGEFTSTHPPAPAHESDYRPTSREDLVVNGQQRTGNQLPHELLSSTALDAVRLWVNDVYASGLGVDLLAGRHDNPLTAGMDTAVQQGTIPVHAELWRGLLLDHDGVERAFPVGETVSDPRFLATATDRDLAESMIAYRKVEKEGEGHMLRILAPAGTHAAPGAQSELVLGRNTRMKVLHRVDGVTTLQVVP